MKKNKIKFERKLLLISIALTFAVLFLFAVEALTDNKANLQAELDSLTSQLSDSGYSWLANYSLTLPSIQVHTKNSDETIAVFNNISEEGWHKIYLTNLTECYDDETEIFTDKGWKLFSELDKTEKVLTLNPETGEKEFNEPSKYQTYEHNDVMYKILLEDGSEMLVSPEHKVYAGIQLNKLSGYEINLNGETTNNLPLNSEDLILLSNFENNENAVSANGGLILNTIIPECSCGGNNLLLRKCLSNVNITLDSDLAILDNCLSANPDEIFLISCPSLINISSIAFGKFSSERNFSSFFEENMFFFSDEFRSICHNREDSRLCKLREIIFENFINTNACAEQFHNLPDHNSCAFESWCSPTNFAVNNNVLVNLNSHNLNYSKELYKSFSLQPVTDVYSKFNNNNEIYFLDSENNPIKISSITKENYNGKIYDVTVDNHIILVRKKNSLGVWSGNSQTQDTFDLKIIKGSVEFDYIVDPVTVNVTIANLTNITLENNFTHLTIDDTQAPYNSLTLYMPFDVNNGSDRVVYDYGRFNRNMFANGRIIWNNSGYIGSAYDFNGVDAKINSSFQLGSVIKNNNATFSLWVKPTGSSPKNNSANAVWNIQAIIGDQDGTFVMNRVNLTSVDDGIWITNYDSNGADKVYVNYTVNEWTHVTVVHNSTTLSIYKNGAFVNSTASGSTSSVTNLLNIGTIEFGVAPAFFNGSIDEVMIFNTSLTAAQISAIYNNQSLRFMNPGIQLFNNTNVSTAGNENRLNVSLGGYQSNFGTNISVSVNGTLFNLSSTGTSDNLQFTTDPNYLNITFTFLSDANKFYTPLMIGNVTFTSWFEQGDTTPPNVTINSPLNQFYGTSTILFNISVLDNTGVSSCLYTLTNGITNYTMSNSTASVWNATNSTMPQGNYLARFYCNDTFNNLNSSETMNFSVDTIYPQINFTSPANNSFSSSTGLDINYTVSDANLQSCWYSNDTMTLNISLGTGGNCVNITTVTWAGRPHNVTIWANDSAGNTNSASVTFTIDAVFPRPRIDYPDSGANYSVNVSQLNYTFTEANPAQCWYSINNGTTNSSTVSCGTNFTNVISNEGNNTWTLYMNDSAGNENKTSTTFFKDTIFPIINITSPINNTYTSNIQISINYTLTETNPQSCWWTSNGGQTNTSLSPCGTNISASITGEGIKTIIIYANDSVGNTNSSSIIYTLDRTEPNLDIVYPVQNTNYNYSVSALNYTARDLNLQTCWYSLDGGLTNTSITCGNNITGLTSSDGIKDWYVWANDSAGNSNRSRVNFLVDTIFPRISFDSGTENANATVSRNWIYANVIVSETNEEVITFLLYNSTGQVNSSSYTNHQRTINWTGLIDGIYFYNVTINDSVGHSNNTEIRNITLDTTSPILTIGKNTSQIEYGSGAININWTAIDINLGSVVFNITYPNNTILFSSTLSNGNINLSSPANLSVLGIYIINLWANDSVGNSNSTSTTFSVNDTIPSTIILLSPNNNSGDSDGNLTFSFNVSDSSSIANCSLIFNGAINQTNSSITKNIIQNFTLNNLAVGAYNWSVNCTDVANNKNNSQTRIFSVVKTLNFAGATTDLSSVNISNITNLVVDIPNYGLINFSQSVDLSAGADVNSYVNISFNRIEINSSALSALNKSARLTLYNLTWETPIIILQDGSTCPDSICTEISYSGGIAVFDVTHFSVYSTREHSTSESVTTTTSSGGGGGGGVITTPKEPVEIEFKIDRESYERTIVVDNTEYDKISISNNEKTKKDFEISVETIGEILSFWKNKITLLSGETKDLEFTIRTPSKPGIYTGKIVISSGITKKEILVTINVKSEKSLFDAVLTIPKSMKTMLVGKNLDAQINLLQMGVKEKMDVTLNYVIKDFSGKVYYTESETIAVQDQKTIQKEFHTEDLSLGDYVLGVEVIYPDGVAVASSQFKIQEHLVEIEPNQTIMTVLTFVVLFVMILIVVLIKRYKRIERQLLKHKRH